MHYARKQNIIIMKNLIVIFIIIIPTSLFSQGWERTYGGANPEAGYSVQQTTDGGYIVTGSSYGSGAHACVYLLKTDQNGDTLWTKKYWDWSNNHDWGYSVQQTTDGGYIITGENSSYSGTGKRSAYLIKTDNNGDISWIKMYGGITNGTVGYSVQQTTDGGYILTGSIWSLENGKDVYLIKTDHSGDTLWTKSYGRCNNEIGYSVRQTDEGGFIITGVTNSCESNTIRSHVYLIKTDVNGDTLWTKIYRKNDYDVGHSVQQTTDGGYIIAGVTHSWWGEEIHDVYLIKTDHNGDTLWTKTLGGESSDEAYSIQQTTDGGYIITGSSDITGSGYTTYDVFLLKLDYNGDTIWSKTFGREDTDIGRSVQQTSDGGYIITGWTFPNSNYSDIYLIKTDENGIITFMTEIPVPDPSRKLMKLIDISGKEISKPSYNQPYIEVYDDGSTRKKMRLK